MLQCWWRTGHLPSYFIPTQGDLTAQESPPPGICHTRQKNANAQGSAGEGGGVGAADWCITFWKRKKTFDFIFKTTFSHQNNGKTVDNSLKTKQIWDWKKKTRTKVCLVSIMTYNLSLPVLRSSVMTKRTSTKLKPTPHLISPEKFKKSIFIIKILLVNFNDVYGIISYWLNETTLWAWWVGTREQETERSSRRGEVR